MTAIVTSQFRVVNAQNFKEDVETSSVYVGIGKADVWSNSTSDKTDTDAFTPYDNQTNVAEAWQNMIGLKKIAAGDVSHVVPRHNWTAGDSYQPWDSNYKESISGVITPTSIFDSQSPFYVMTSQFKVYKCIIAGPAGVSVEPVHTSEQPIGAAEDGYQWKYMYTVTVADSEKFLTTSYMPVKTLALTPALAATDPNQPQQAAQIASNASANREGIERLVLVTNGVDSVTSGSGYSTTNRPTVTITGDGINAAADITAQDIDSSGRITSITITNKGSNYTVADVVITKNTSDSGTPVIAEARAVLAPAGGHGVDPVAELGAFYVGINSLLTGNEGSGNDLTINQDFRQVSLIKNPSSIASGVSVGAIVAGNLTTPATATTLKGTQFLKIASGQSSVNFNADQVIVGGASGARAFVVEAPQTGAQAGRIYYHQNEKTGYTKFTTGETVSTTADGGAGSASLDTTGNGGFNFTAEAHKGSGEMVFLENRAPISRTATQIEDIKLIIEF